MKRSILLAENDSSVRRMVARVLESAGYGVLLAGEKAESLAQPDSLKADLALLDLDLPDEQGWLAIARVHRVHPLWPIIVMTAWPNQREQAARQGVAALLEKPLDLQSLLTTIQELLARSEPEPVDRSGEFQVR